MLVGHHQLRVELHPFAQAVAFGAGPLRRVKAEKPRRYLGNGEAADRASEFFGKNDAVGGQAGAFHARFWRAAFPFYRKP